MILSPDFVKAIVARLKAEEPTLEAVLLAGSYARQEADEHSDVDVVAVTRDEPAVPYSAWYVPDAGGRLVHVSIAAERLERADEADEEPAPWALGFPVLEVQTYLWRTSEAERVLGADPSGSLPPGTPELEDFVDLYMKVRRAAGSGDEVILRWAARLLGEYGVGLLRPLNPEVVVRSPVEAVRAALALTVTPAHFREDFESCTGLNASSDGVVAAAASRLAREMMAFLQPHSAKLGLDDATVEAALREGVLARYAGF